MMSFSPTARDAVRRDLAADEALRIAFAGGCGAPAFRIAATRRVGGDDHRVEVEGVTVLLDRMAVRELTGATLDYDDERGFFVEHPAWGASC